MKQKIILNLYVPINTILICNDDWRNSLNLPKLTQQDIKIINDLRKSSALPFIGGNLTEQKELLLDSNMCLRKVKSLSFYEFLLNNFLQEARNAAEAGIKNFLVENSNAPYFNEKEPVIYWLMRCFVSELKLICTDEFTIGLKLNGNIDDWAMDIACRNKINYIYAQNYSPELSFYRNQFTHKPNIYYIFDENNFSIIQEGFIVDSDKIDNKVKFFTNLYGCRNYVQQLPFYPIDKTIPIIIDLWDENEINTYIDTVEYVITNSCFSKHGYADCGLDINKILSL